MIVLGLEIFLFWYLIVCIIAMYPIPTSGRTSGKKQRGQKHLAHTGGGVSGQAKKKELVEHQTNVKLTVASVILIATVTIVTIVLIVLNRPTASYIQQLCNKVERSEIKPSVWQINQCSESECVFNIDLCTEECPFGYEKDPNTLCAVSCQCADNGLIEGDVGFQSDQIPSLIGRYFGTADQSQFSLQSNHPGFNRFKWPKQNGKVDMPYYAAAKEGASVANAMAVAAEWFAKHTCINLHPVTSSPPDHISSLVVTLGKDCSYIEKDSKDKSRIERISLGIYCHSTPIVIHEVMHALGFYHEQARPDRDYFIRVFPHNIQEESKLQFRTVRPRHPIYKLDFDYDTASVMHYDSFAFSNGKGPTLLIKEDINTVKEDGFISAPEKPSELDITKINTYYECGDKIGGSGNGQWTPWSEFTACIGKCGKGIKVRSRRCHDESKNHTFGCDGDAAESMTCYLRNCLGMMTDWSQWSPCVGACGGGTQYRTRSCEPLFECGYSPNNPRQETKSCSAETNCEEEYNKTGSWAEWSSWSVCPTTCYSNLDLKEQVSKRYRRCLDGRRHAAFDCSGMDKFESDLNKAKQQESKKCECNFVVTVGNNFIRWGEWKTWSECSAVCEGTRIRSRVCEPSKESPQCTEPKPMDNETEPCGKRSCQQEATDVFGPIWTSRISLCYYGTIVTGFFNKDKREDLLCWYSDGYIRLYFSNVKAQFLQVSWEGKTPFCLDDITERFRVVGDVNGDGMDDLLCLYAHRSEVQVMFNRGGKFGNEVDATSGANVDATLREHIPQCIKTNPVLRLVDLNNDKRADLLCGTNRQAIHGVTLNVFET